MRGSCGAFLPGSARGGANGPKWSCYPGSGPLRAAPLPEDTPCYPARAVEGEPWSAKRGQRPARERADPAARPRGRRSNAPASDSSAGRGRPAGFPCDRSRNPGVLTTYPARKQHFQMPSAVFGCQTKAKKKQIKRPSPALLGTETRAIVCVRHALCF